MIIQQKNILPLDIEVDKVVAVSNTGRWAVVFSKAKHAFYLINLYSSLHHASGLYQILKRETEAVYFLAEQDLLFVHETHHSYSKLYVATLSNGLPFKEIISRRFNKSLYFYLDPCAQLWYLLSYRRDIKRYAIWKVSCTIEAELTLDFHKINDFESERALMLMGEDAKLFGLPQGSFMMMNADSLYFFDNVHNSLFDIGIEVKNLIYITNKDEVWMLALKHFEFYTAKLNVNHYYQDQTLQLRVKGFPDEEYCAYTSCKNELLSIKQRQLAFTPVPTDRKVHFQDSYPLPCEAIHANSSQNGEWIVCFDENKNLTVYLKH